MPVGLSYKSQVLTAPLGERHWGSCKYYKKPIVDFTMGKGSEGLNSSGFTIALCLADSKVRERLRLRLQSDALSVLTMGSPNALKDIEPPPAVLVVDSKSAGSAALAKLVKGAPAAQIIIWGDLPSPAASALDGVPNVWATSGTTDQEAVVMLVAKACVVHELSQRTAELEYVVGGGIAAPQIPFRSVKMQEVMRQVRQIADRDATVLLRGETGTGKTTIARLIHDLSSRKQQPFVTLSCAALPRELLEAELFGYERGAFTGAVQSRPGCAELADKGTLFLDEIGDLPFEMQPKLLTFLQERWVRRIGGREVKHPDVRIIAATNRDLHGLVQAGTFREDLLYRLEVLELVVPPLRQRTEDIAVISDFYLRQSANRRKESARRLTTTALRKLEAHRWPGNVRELQNVLERALTYATGVSIDPDDLRFSAARESPLERANTAFFGLTLKQLEKLAIAETLERTGGDKIEAAKILGISLKSIYNKLKA